MSTEEHPAFTKAKSLEEPWRSHFPKDAVEARLFKELVVCSALSSRVLVVANTRIECAWCAYCDAVRGNNHDYEKDEVLLNGTKLSEKVARVLFPQFDSIPYAK